MASIFSAPFVKQNWRLFKVCLSFIRNIPFFTNKKITQLCEAANTNIRLMQKLTANLFKGTGLVIVEIVTIFIIWIPMYLHVLSESPFDLKLFATDITLKDFYIWM